MTKKELIAKLEAAANESMHDPEVGHYQADMLLLEYINDPKVSEVWEKVCKWYA